MIIPVRTKEGGYDIVLETGALERAGEYLNLDRRVLIVSDTGVPERYAECIARASREPVRVTIPAGEASKNLSQWEELLRTMLEHSFARGDCVAAVGGGVTGDLAGFAAACYMRGIEFYNIPTTLLSQVDSSIGGKTAVDFGGVKNIVGSFYPPARVLIDPDVLGTLPARELHAGLAEAVKMAATCDGELFGLIERSESLEEDLPEIIRRALLIKKRVVEEDPLEHGLRRVLNFGHTAGHAVESLGEGSLLHGECVALGMLPMSSGAARERIRRVLVKYDLPVRIPFGTQELLSYMKHDKKMQGDRVCAVFVEEIGSARMERVRPEDILRRVEETA